MKPSYKNIGLPKSAEHEQYRNEEMMLRLQPVEIEVLIQPKTGWHPGFIYETGIDLFKEMDTDLSQMFLTKR